METQILFLCIMSIWGNKYMMNNFLSDAEVLIPVIRIKSQPLVKVRERYLFGCLFSQCEMVLLTVSEFKLNHCLSMT